MATSEEQCATDRVAKGCCCTIFLFALSRVVGVVGTEWMTGGLGCCLTGEGPIRGKGAGPCPCLPPLAWWCLRAEDEATLWTSETASDMTE